MVARGAAECQGVTAASALTRTEGTGQRTHELRRHGIRFVAESARVMPEAANFSTRRMAAGLPFVLPAFVVVEVDVFSPDVNGDVKLGQRDQSKAGGGGGNDLAPGKNGEMIARLEAKATLTLPVTFGLPLEPEFRQFDGP